MCRAKLTTLSNMMKSKLAGHALRWTSLQAQWCTAERSISGVAALHTVAHVLSVLARQLCTSTDTSL